MKVLFTGGSSFTGYWFVSELVRAGHEVVAVFRNGSGKYTETRGERVEALASLCRPVYECDFGSPAFLDLITSEPAWDLLCHHAADVTNYKSPDFDVAAALQNNTTDLKAVLEALKERGCRKVALTGSVFENAEGAGSEGLPAFSPYGLSKGLTSEVFRYYVATCRMRLGKFVIPNPFGPYEEPRFTQYLMRCWQKGETPSVQTPAYVRDNIHASLLAKAYVRFVGRLRGEPGFEKINPSGYVETQGNFATRFSGNMRRRLDLDCTLELAEQTEFAEPRVRINTDVIDGQSLNWSESEAWDDLADYYCRALGCKPRHVSSREVQ